MAVEAQVDQIESIRRGTPVVLLLRTETPGSKDSYTFYLYDPCALVERVDPDGAIEVDLVATTDLATYMMDALDPIHCAGDHRELGQFPTMDDFADRAAQFPVLAETVVLSTLTLADKQTALTRACVVYASPSAVAILQGGPSPDNPYILTEASPDDLAAAIDHLIAGVTLPDFPS